LNKVVLVGRLCQEPEVRYTNDQKPIARYTLAVDRNKDEADFIPCVAFQRSAEFAQKYLHKGTKILVEGRMHSGSYTNREGKKVYTMDVFIDRHEFVESRKSAEDADGFMNIPEGDVEGLPFE